MKKNLVLWICVCVTLQAAAGQWREGLSFAATVGTGIALSKPSLLPPPGK